MSAILTDLVSPGAVLVLAPHPDDEALGCGALLAACWDAGRAAHVACLTDGAASHPGSIAWPTARLSALRRLELETAVTRLGGVPARDVTWLGHPDAGLHRVAGPGADLARDVARLVDRLGAATLFAPSPLDPHCDHEAAAAAALRVRALRPGLRVQFYPVWSRWTGGGTAPRPEGSRRRRFAPPDLALRKSAAIEAHASQAGRVVTDDPGGFAMPAGFARMFTEGAEVFDEVGGPGAWR